MKEQRFEEADDERDTGLSQSYEGTGDDTEVRDSQLRKATRSKAPCSWMTTRHKLKWRRDCCHCIGFYDCA